MKDRTIPLSLLDETLRDLELNESVLCDDPDYDGFMIIVDSRAMLVRFGATMLYRATQWDDRDGESNWTDTVQTMLESAVDGPDADDILVCFIGWRIDNRA